MDKLSVINQWLIRLRYLLPKWRLNQIRVGSIKVAQIVIAKIITYFWLTQTALAQANFNVVPLKINIDLPSQSGTALVINQNNALGFTAYVKQEGQDSATQELFYSPTKFILAPHKTQLVRVMLRPGLNYADKKYVLYITTNIENLPIPGAPHSFQIPINIDNVSTANLVSQQEKTSNRNKFISHEDDTTESGALTKIRIAIPIKADIE